MHGKIDWFVLGMTAFIAWGCMTFRYVGNGFSLAAIAFGVLVIFLFATERYVPRMDLPKNLGKALVFFYGTLLAVGVLQQNGFRNFVGESYSAVDLLAITAPFWMILYVGWKWDIRKVVSFVVYANMYAFSLYGLWLYVSQGQHRFCSFYGSPPEVGMLLDLLIPFSVAIGAYYWDDRKWRFAAFLLIPLELLALVLTETRGSYLAMTAALLLVTAVWIKRNCRRISMFLRVGICATAVAVSCLAVGYTFYIGSDNAIRMVGGERLLMWESSWHMAQDHPLLGIGLSEWSVAYNAPDSPYRLPEARETTNVQTHNIYLHFLATGGVVSLLAVLAYLWFMIKWLLYLTKEQMRNPFAWAMLFMFIAFMAHGMVDGTLNSRHIGRIFYLLLGTGLLYTKRWEQE